MCTVIGVAWWKFLSSRLSLCLKDTVVTVGPTAGSSPRTWSSFGKKIVSEFVVTSSKTFWIHDRDVLSVKTLTPKLKLPLMNKQGQLFWGFHSFRVTLILYNMLNYILQKCIHLPVHFLAAVFPAVSVSLFVAESALVGSAAQLQSDSIVKK